MIQEIERRFGFKTNRGPYTYIKKFRPCIHTQTKPLLTHFDEWMINGRPTAAVDHFQ